MRLRRQLEAPGRSWRHVEWPGADRGLQDTEVVQGEKDAGQEAANIQNKTVRARRLLSVRVNRRIPNFETLPAGAAWRGTLGDADSLSLSLLTTIIVVSALFR